MEVLFLLGMIVACHAGVNYDPSQWAGSKDYFNKDNKGNYAYGHTNHNPNGPSFHSEAGDSSGAKVGSYGVSYPNGRMEIVEYVADANGFRANVKSSETLDTDRQNGQNEAPVRETADERKGPGDPSRVNYAYGVTNQNRHGYSFNSEPEPLDSGGYKVSFYDRARTSERRSKEHQKNPFVRYTGDEPIGPEDPVQNTHPSAYYPYPHYVKT